MARRRSSRRRSSRGRGGRRGGGIRRTGGRILNFIRKPALALGGGLIAGAALDRVAPQFSPVGQLITEFSLGGVTGLVLAEVVKPFLGLPSALGGITQVFSGFGGNGQAETESL